MNETTVKIRTDVDYLQKTAEFIKTLNQAHGRQIDTVDELGTLRMRMRLIKEEARECEEAALSFQEAVCLLEHAKHLWEGEKAPDLTLDDVRKRKAELLKELSDLLYVVFGMAVTFDLPIAEAFLRVHESNMSKLGEDGKPLYREDGKVLKGPNYKAPDLLDLC